MWGSILGGGVYIATRGALGLVTCTEVLHVVAEVLHAITCVEVTEALTTSMVITAIPAHTLT